MNTEPGSYDKLIITKVFKVIAPEIYSYNIPKYYLQENKGHLPVLNGVRVSWEEFLEANPDYQRDESFVPEVVYEPSENNMTTTMVTVAVIVDMIDNNVQFSITDPDVNYPEIIRIMDGFLRLSDGYSMHQDELRIFIGKVRRALEIFQKCYDRYKTRCTLRATGRLPRDHEDPYEKILKRFR